MFKWRRRKKGETALGSTDDARTAKAASVMERKKPRRAPVGDAAAEATSLALRRNEEQLRELFTHASDAIFVADLDGHYTDVNEAGCSLLGYSRAELIGKGIVDLIVPEDVARLAHSKTQMLEGRVQIGEWALRNITWDYVDEAGEDQGPTYRAKYGSYDERDGQRTQRSKHDHEQRRCKLERLGLLVLVEQFREDRDEGTAQRVPA